MSRHLAIELLSSYMDEEVSRRQLRLVESHLGDCAECRRALEGLRSVAASVRRLESVAPPSTLGVAMERRISVGDRDESGRLGFERGLGRWLGQPVLAPVFAVVLALGAIVYLYSYGLSIGTERPTRVVVASLPEDEMVQEVAQTSPNNAGDESKGAPVAEPGAARFGGRADLPAEPVQPALLGTGLEDKAETADEPVPEASAPEAADNADIAAQPEDSETATVARRRSLMKTARPEEPRQQAESLPESLEADQALRDSESQIRSIAGRTFVNEGELWVEQAVRGETVDELLDLTNGSTDTPADLAPFSGLGRVRLRRHSRVVEVVYPSSSKD